MQSDHHYFTNDCYVFEVGPDLGEKNIFSLKRCLALDGASFRKDISLDL